jgi:hypothetical protein
MVKMATVYRVRPQAASMAAGWSCEWGEGKACAVFASCRGFSLNLFAPSCGGLDRKKFAPWDSTLIDDRQEGLDLV